MKTNEFIDYMKKNTNKAMKEDQVLSVAKKIIESRQYLPIKEKKELVDKIIDECIYYDNGVYKIHGIERYVYFTMYTIAAYTNLELSDNVESDFDALSESKLLSTLVCAIQHEYDEVSIYLQMQCDFVLENNSLEAQVGKFLNGTLDVVDTLVTKLSSYVKDVDIEKLLNSNDDIGKLVNFVNTIKNN